MKRVFCILFLFISILSYAQDDLILSTKVSEDNSSVDVKIPYGMIAIDGEMHVPTYLCRSVDGGNYEILNDSILVFEYTDRDVDLTNHSYTYALYYATLDYPIVDAISVIRLTASKMNESKVRLSWNAATEDNSAVYEIYRYPFSQRDNAELIGTTSSASFVDNHLSALPSDKMCYYVKAYYKPFEEANSVTLDCISTTSTLSSESIFFCPNAFAPKDGVNTQVQTFKPECHFVRSGSYSMKIYNRWGTLLFETTNPDEGWDGKYNDKYCPVGTYVYKIVFVDDEGMQQDKKGTFLLFD